LFIAVHEPIAVLQAASRDLLADISKRVVEEKIEGHGQSSRGNGFHFPGAPGRIRESPAIYYETRIKAYAHRDLIVKAALS
jgi:hypothetical protein